MRLETYENGVLVSVEEVPDEPAWVTNFDEVGTYMRDIFIPRMREARTAADASITAAQAAKTAAQNAKALPITTVAEARVALRALCDAVIDGLNVTIDQSRVQKDLAAGAIKHARRSLEMYDGVD